LAVLKLELEEKEELRYILEGTVLHPTGEKHT